MKTVKEIPAGKGSQTDYAERYGEESSAPASPVSAPKVVAPPSAPVSPKKPEK